MSKVFIFGCGYLGLHLVDALHAQGFTVGALTKNPSTVEQLRGKGFCEVIESRLELDDWHKKITSDYTHVVNCVSSAGNGLSGYRSSYYDGQASIVRWARSLSIERFIYTSSTSVYSKDNGSWVDEGVDSLGVEWTGSETGAILREAESMIEGKQSVFKNHYILRLSGIYGPRRHYLLNQLRSGKGIQGSGESYMNMIHVADIVGVVLRLIQSEKPFESGIYNLSDNQPTPKNEVANWLAQEAGLGKPVFNANTPTERQRVRKTRSKNRRISNEKLKETLNYSFLYPSYREGYADILKGFQD